MPDFVNIGPAVDVYRPAGDADSLHVEAGQTVTVPGDLAEEQPEDAYLVGTGDDARLWPKGQWELKSAPKSNKGGAQPAKSDAAPAGQSEGTN